VGRSTLGMVTLNQGLCETGVAAASAKMLPRMRKVFIAGSDELDWVLLDGGADSNRIEEEGCLVDGQLAEMELC
jgi:hypothetical protein